MTSLNERLEICTDDEDAWAAFQTICTESFQDHSAFRYSHPDPEKRKQFLPAYFKYVYETELSHGRAGLVCARVAPGTSKPKIVYGICAIYHQSQRTDADKSEMLAAGETAMQRSLKEDEWIETAIKGKIRLISDQLGVIPLYIYYQACPKEYINRGLGTKYMNEAIKLLVADGIKRGAIPPNAPVLLYGQSDGERSKIFQTTRTRSFEVAHLHRPSTPASPVRCCHDARFAKDEDVDCIFVVCKTTPKQTNVIEQIKEAFRPSSQL